MTTSAPSEARDLALSLLASRVTALTWNWLEALGSSRMDFTMEPPCLPVAPKTVMVCLAILRVLFVEEGDEEENLATSLWKTEGSFGMRA